MSVPSRSSLKCARVRLPGARFRVSLLPGNATAAEMNLWLEGMHRCLQEQGIAALAALVEALRKGPEPTPRWIAKRAPRWTGDPAPYVVHELAKRADTLPPGLGVFMTDVSGSGGGGATQLDYLGSLAVLARRGGTLYLPARPIEPSLVTLDSCLLVFPAAPVTVPGGRGDWKSMMQVPHQPEGREP